MLKSFTFRGSEIPKKLVVSFLFATQRKANSQEKKTNKRKRKEAKRREKKVKRG
jgi:hypothetical protein